MTDTEKVNIHEVLEELKFYGVEDRIITSIMQNVVKSQVSKKYKIFLDDKEIMIKDTIQNSIKACEDYLTSKYGDIETAKCYHYFRNLNNRVYPDMEGQLRYNEYGQVNVVDLVLYAIKGIPSNDYSEAYKIWDTVRNKDNFLDNMQPYKFMIEHITVQLFKNGKVKLSGLSPDEQNRIDDGYKLIGKFRN